MDTETLALIVIYDLCKNFRGTKYWTKSSLLKLLPQEFQNGLFSTIWYVIYQFCVYDTRLSLDSFYKLYHWMHGVLTLILAVDTDLYHINQLVVTCCCIAGDLKYCRVLHDYSATESNQLSLHVGDLITIISKAAEGRGWWKGWLNGKVRWTFSFKAFVITSAANCCSLKLNLV